MPCYGFVIGEPAFGDGYEKRYGYTIKEIGAKVRGKFQQQKFRYLKVKVFLETRVFPIYGE
jgi:hypothetical protein